jgi:hypothetical protein
VVNAEPPTAENKPMNQSISPAAEDVPSLPFPLQEGESILQICRRHWLFLWPSVLLQAVIAIVPLIMAAVILDQLGIDGTPAQVIWGLLAIHVVYRVLKAFLTWYRYHHDLWVITNQRLIDSYKRHPFSLQIATADLVNVQDMSVERDGILRTMLDYGDIVCQTAGQVQGFRLAGIPHPRTVQALVDKERDRERLRTR